MALATPKSITLGTACWSYSATRMFDGLMSRWMIPFWCACWMAWQTGRNKFQPLAGRQPVLVAVLRDRLALNQFHDEVRAVRCR